MHIYIYSRYIYTHIDIYIYIYIYCIHIPRVLFVGVLLATALIGGYIKVPTQGKKLHFGIRNIVRGIARQPQAMLLDDPLVPTTENIYVSP